MGKSTWVWLCVLSDDYKCQKHIHGLSLDITSKLMELSQQLWKMDKKRLQMSTDDSGILQAHLPFFSLSGTLCLSNYLGCLSTFSSIWKMTPSGLFTLVLTYHFLRTLFLVFPLVGNIVRLQAISPQSSSGFWDYSPTQPKPHFSEMRDRNVRGNGTRNLLLRTWIRVRWVRLSLASNGSNPVCFMYMYTLILLP